MACDNCKGQWAYTHLIQKGVRVHCQGRGKRWANMSGCWPRLPGKAESQKWGGTQPSRPGNQTLHGVHEAGAPDGRTFLEVLLGSTPENV